MLAALMTDDVFVFMLVFTRLGAALMVMPGIGDSYVSPRIRLLFALLMTAVVLPPLMPRLPAPPGEALMLALMLGGEVMIGVFIGQMARILVAALEVGGTVIGMQTSLGNAFIFNPAMGSQGSLPSMFLTTLGVLLIFVTDLHHLLLLGLANSYEAFPVGVVPPVDDMADTISRLVAQSFLIGIQIGAPFLVVGLIFYVGLGLLSRLMPQMQIFFIAIPLQIAIGLTVMALVLSGTMLFWLGRFQNGLIGLMPG